MGQASEQRAGALKGRGLEGRGAQTPRGRSSQAGLEQQG